MMNLVAKLLQQTPHSGDDEGVVAIEYVLTAGFVAAGVAVVFATNLWQDLLQMLNAL